ncbi:MAG: hypothetical protein U5N53_09515 [Mycobacterium sp.]|nr:hypothetical protein [Mycobacterium sp.]
MGELLTPLPEFLAACSAGQSDGAIAHRRCFGGCGRMTIIRYLLCQRWKTRPAQLGLWLAETRNDLQLPAVKLVPIIGEIVDYLSATQGCILPACRVLAPVFGLFGSEGQASGRAGDASGKSRSLAAAAPLIVPEA